MTKKSKKVKVTPKQHVKTSSTAERKREERETKLRLRKEAARKRNYESLEEKEFADELLEKGFVIHVVEGDGNCMFRSISDQLFGTTEHHEEIREKVVNYMEKNKDHFCLFIEDDEPFDEYIDRMRVSREWGGHQELFAASCCLHATVIVYQAQTPRWILPAPDNVDNAVSIYLSYHGEYHYNSLHFVKGKEHEADVQCRIQSKTKDIVNLEEEIEHLVQTLPWITNIDAKDSLQRCKFDFSQAVEYAIEHYFAANQESVTADSSSFQASHQSLKTPSLAREDPVVKESKTVQKVNPNKRLSKKEKRLLKKCKADVKTKSSDATPVDDSNSILTTDIIL